MNAIKKVTDASNGGATFIATGEPYVAHVKLRGVSDILFHRWNAEAVDTKAAAKKNSVAKKTDNIESYVYRNDDGNLCIPGEYVRQAVITAAKFRQDPRSPRKSAMDLFKAGIVSLTDLADLGVPAWDYEDRRRVVIQRAGINRVRPAMRVGWVAEFQLMVNVPEYVSPDFLQEVLEMAGRLVGIGDFRPSYGRFSVAEFSIGQ